MFDNGKFWRDLSVKICRRDLEPTERPARFEAWLSPRELEELSTFRSPKRRSDWLSGRWCGKRLLLSRGGELLNWEILSRSPQGLGQVPRVLYEGRPVPLSLSLSHNDSLSVAACLPGQGETVGVDVVDPQTGSGGFASMWFHESELSVLKVGGFTPAEGWAVKEAAFKAVGREQTFRPRLMKLVDISGDRCWIRSPGAGESCVETRIERTDNATIAVARYAADEQDQPTRSSNAARQ